MNNSLRLLLGLLTILLFVTSPLIAGPGGGGHGGGGHGGGGWNRGGSDRGGGGRSGGGADWNHGGSVDRSGGDHRSGTQGHGGGDRAPTYVAPQSHGAPQGHGDFHDYHSGHPMHMSPAGHAGFHGGPSPYHPLYPHYAHWYHGDWHDHWVHPWHYGPVAWFTVGFVAGSVVWDVPWYWGYYPYYNPYYTEVIVVGGTPFDYSRPIVLASPPPPDPLVVNSASVLESQAAQLLESSRDAFRRGDYQAAATLVDQAIAKTPRDTVLHEYRGLILFAMRQYRASAAVVFAVLSVGPGWDWATLSGFYPSPDVYTAQLRDLESYRDAHPTEPEIRFLLGYHYMSCGYTEAAAREFQEATRLNPKDQLSAQLLAGLTTTDAPATSTTPSLAGPTLAGPSQSSPPAAAATPVTAANVQGEWQASRSEGESFSFRLSADMTYSWEYRQNDKTQQFTGTYAVAENLLILKRDGTATMIGQITLTDPNHFNFKLVGNNPSDPGITFSRK